jgi:hypothetical protein
MKTSHEHILKEVFRRAGNKNRLAKALNVSRQYISAWKKVPLARLNDVAQITQIPKNILRPDVYN